LKAHLVIPAIVSILILGTLGFSQEAFADPPTLFHTTFVDSFSVTAQEGVARDITFSPDGTKMFVVGFGGGGEVSEYTLTTPFDTSTRSFVDSFSVSAQGSVR